MFSKHKFEPVIYHDVPEGNGIYSDVLVESQEQEDIVLSLFRAKEEKENKPTWRNTLRQAEGAQYGHILDIRLIAKMIKYDYFVWNDRVYSVESAQGTNWTLTDLDET